MLARELISDTIPPLRPNDEVARALAWMDEFKVSHLPVVDGTRYIGLISEDNVMDGQEADLVSASREAYDFASVTEAEHIYNVIRKLAATDLTVMPVLSTEGVYLGCISIFDLLTRFEELAVVNQPGGIIILQLNKNDYSLAQVAHVVESDSARILSSYVVEDVDTGKMELTLKLDREEVGSIVQSLERYDYDVQAYFQETAHLEDLKGRYDELMRYINI